MTFKYTTKFHSSEKKREQSDADLVISVLQKLIEKYNEAAARAAVYHKEESFTRFDVDYLRELDTYTLQLNTRQQLVNSKAEMTEEELVAAIEQDLREKYGLTTSNDDTNN